MGTPPTILRTTSASCCGNERAASDTGPAHFGRASVTITRRHLYLLAVGGALGLTLWAAMAPVGADSNEQVFEIPKGTWAQRMAGDAVEILPEEIRLTLGVRDVLVLKNSDDVPQMFGPTLMMPGQSFRLPFDMASEYQFACTAHASGQMTIIVEPFPSTPWARLRWRLLELMKPDHLRIQEA
jgi:plastocyanin